MGVPEKPPKSQHNIRFIEFDQQRGTTDNSNHYNNTIAVAGIQLMAPRLKPISVDNKKKTKKNNNSSNYADEDEYGSTTTPKSVGSMIPLKSCPPPPPPRKRKPAPRCSFSDKDFFHPPDLDTVFIRRHY